jgi:UDP-arabinose 4-epimerase
MGPFEHGDLHECENLKKVLETYEPLAVIHFAASAYVGESVENPFKYYKNNVGGTLSLLDAMRQTGQSRIVFSSSCITYGAPDTKFILESCPQRPITIRAKQIDDRTDPDGSRCVRRNPLYVTSLF